MDLEGALIGAAYGAAFAVVGLVLRGTVRVATRRRT
jgi:hypothetical protein